MNVERHISKRARRMINRLGVELRRVAIQTLNGRVGDPFGPSLIDWHVVHRAQRAIRAGNLKELAALTTPERACELLGVSLDGLAPALAPAFPQAPLSIARRIALGESPADIAGGELTRREAHEWLSEAPMSAPTLWLATKLGVPWHRSIRVIRWFSYVKQRGLWHTVERPRRVFTRAKHEIPLGSQI